MRHNFLEFRDESLIGQKTERFGVYNSRSEDFLGMIKWNSGWRRYVMDFEASTYWDLNCLKQCYNFISKLMEKRKKTK